MQEDNLQISKAVINEALRIINLQEKLINIELVQLVQKWLFEFKFCSSEFGMTELFEETIVILQVRPKLIELLSSLYFSLIGPNSPQSYLKEHKLKILHYFFPPTIFHLQLPSQSIVLHFLRKLFQYHLLRSYFY